MQRLVDRDTLADSVRVLREALARTRQQLNAGQAMQVCPPLVLVLSSRFCWIAGVMREPMLENARARPMRRSLQHSL